jgi:transitional endoplasmic reticulum ATPase
MMKAAVRSYEARDFPGVLTLLQRSEEGAQTVERLLPLLASEDSVAVVAEAGGVLAGVAAGVAAGETGWVGGVVAADQEIVARLLDAVEAALADRGVSRVAVMARETSGLDRRGYVASGLGVYERVLPGGGSHRAIAELGGRMIDAGLWDELRGMDEPKEIIERRVILPLAEPELARRHGVVQPKSIILFGPPGTGKTTFAKGASRLGWPFFEVSPSEIGAEGAERQAKLLAETFDGLLEVPAAVVFVDEVEDLASIRSDERRVSPSVTNEFLKQIPRMREAPHHLLACATNWVSRLDPAFLRPGRFDDVLPVGPPDAEAREMIWQRSIGEITDEPVDVDALVSASDLFTPADIEWSARTAAQRAFEREHFDGVGRRATTEDFLGAVGSAKPTLTPAMIDEFRSETERFKRA